MKKLFLMEFDTSDKNATAENVEKNVAETAEKEKKADYPVHLTIDGAGSDNTDT